MAETKNRKIKVNFEGVESGSMYVRVPEGDYGMKISKVTPKEGDKGVYLLIAFKLTKGPSKGVGKTLPHTASLTKNSLWNLRSILEACGKQVPSKAVTLDLDKMVGWECAGTVIDDEYQGKPKSVVSAFFPLADLNESAEEPEGEGEEAPEGEEAEGAEEPEEEEAEELFG